MLGFGYGGDIESGDYALFLDSQSFAGWPVVRFSDSRVFRYA